MLFFSNAYPCDGVTMETITFPWVTMETITSEQFKLQLEQPSDCFYRNKPTPFDQSELRIQQHCATVEHEMNRSMKTATKPFGA